MIIVKIEGNLSLEKALKTLKRKWDRSKTLKELRDRKEFTKKSIKRRNQVKKAKYVQEKFKSD